MRTFHEVFRSESFSETVKDSLESGDASAFYKNRIMNLQKLFPYIPDCLNAILLHFTVNTTQFYESVRQIVSDLDVVLEEMPAS